MSRILKLRQLLNEKEIPALLVHSGENRRYLSGFTGSTGWLYVDAQRQMLVTDGRYWSQVQEQCPGWQLVKFEREHHHSLGVALLTALEGIKPGKLGFEATQVSFSAYESLQKVFSDWQLEPTRGLVEELRAIKDADEVEALRRAAACADAAFKRALGSFQAGIKESDFCLELEYQMRKGGARKASFDSIVASGPNGALPHAGVSERAIQVGELVTVDFGAYLDGYVSDMTRTIWIGPLDELSNEVWNTVWRAQRAALKGVRPGITAAQLDKIARDSIQDAGYGEAFLHSLGHGIGLEVHESPGLRSTSEEVLKSGMAITVEPGVYLAGKTGCRIEDSVVVREGEPDFLTLSPYQKPGQEHPLEAY